MTQPTFAHHLTFTLQLPGVTVQQLHDFHHRPDAFQLLSPPGSVRKVTGDIGPLHDGQRLVLHLRKFGLPLQWVALHSRVSPNGFMDTQLSGPFAAWQHQHLFQPTPEGCKLLDVIDFTLPLEPLSRIALPLVLADVREMFAYRHRVTREWLLPRA